MMTHCKMIKVWAVSVLLTLALLVPVPIQAQDYNCDDCDYEAVAPRDVLPDEDIPKRKQ